MISQLETFMLISAIGTGNAAASLSRIFWAILVRFGQIWLDLSKIKANCGEIWAKVIKFC